MSSLYCFYPEINIDFNCPSTVLHFHWRKLLLLTGGIKHEEKARKNQFARVSVEDCRAFNQYYYAYQEGESAIDIIERAMDKFEDAEDRKFKFDPLLN